MSWRSSQKIWTLAQKNSEVTQYKKTQAHIMLIVKDCKKDTNYIQGGWKILTIFKSS